MALTLREKKDLAQHIQKGITVICSSIAQLHLASPDPNATTDETGIITALRRNGPNKWKFTNIEGALLLVRDKDGFVFFKIYDLDLYKLRFHYEIYENLEYVKLNENFQCFEMEGCICGFNFSDQEVAKKFFHRVKKAIPKNSRGVSFNSNGNNNVNGEMLFSPDFRNNKPQPAQSVKKRGTDNNMSNYNPVDTTSSKSSGSAPNFEGTGMQSSKKKKGKNKKKLKSTISGSAENSNSNNVYLQNGLLDAENIPHEWKKILRNAGIRKKDLKNPNMQQIIKETLEQFNISIEPPPLDMDDAEVRQFYTAEQLEEYERYKREMEAYEEDIQRYNREMAAYEEYQKKQAKLERLARITADSNVFSNKRATMNNMNNIKSRNNNAGKNVNIPVRSTKNDSEAENEEVEESGEDRLRQSVFRLQGKNVSVAIPTMQMQELAMPRMSMNRPLLPALPKIDETKNKNLSNEQNMLNKMTNDLVNNNKRGKSDEIGQVQERQSKMIISAPSFLADIQKGNVALKHVSVLPDLKNVDQGNKDGILNMLMERIKDQRKFLRADDSDEEDSDDGFSD